MVDYNFKLHFYTSKCLKRTFAIVFLQRVEQRTDSQINTLLSRGLTRRYLIWENVNFVLFQPKVHVQQFTLQNFAKRGKYKGSDRNCNFLHPNGGMQQ